MAQVVELLPSKYEALSSNPSEKKKKGREEERKEGKRGGERRKGLWDHMSPNSRFKLALKSHYWARILVPALELSPSMYSIK
jgi:hypothetical protein